VRAPAVGLDHATFGAACRGGGVEVRSLKEFQNRIIAIWIHTFPSKDGGGGDSVRIRGFLFCRVHGFGWLVFSTHERPRRPRLPELGLLQSGAHQHAPAHLHGI